MRCVYLLASFFVLTLLAKPSMTQQDPKQNETPVGQSQPEFTEVEKAWWKEFEKTEGELIQLEEDKRQALEAVKMQVEKSYRERQDSRLDKMQEEVFRKQQPVHLKFAPFIERAITSYQATLAAGVDQNLRVPLEDKRLPTVIHREKAKYTEDARQNRVQGTVAVSVVFQPNGKCTNLRVIKGLPDGLIEKAIEAVTKLAFRPSVQHNRFIAVRGTLEYTFNLF